MGDYTQVAQSQRLELVGRRRQSEAGLRGQAGLVYAVSLPKEVPGQAKTDTGWTRRAQFRVESDRVEA